MKFFLPALALLFIGLKLGGVIAWSWLWVLAPLLWVGLHVFALWAIIDALLVTFSWDR